MIALALDTSTIHGTVALFRKEEGRPAQLIADANWARKGSHSEVVTANIAQLLQDNSLSSSDLNQICTGIGPGSFTGIRVAINVARALAYSCQCKVQTLDSLRLLAEPALQKHNDVLAMTNAFKNMVYCSWYRNENGRVVEKWSPQALTMEGLDNSLSNADGSTFVCVGDGFDVYHPHLSPAVKSRIIRDDTLSDFPNAQSFGQICLDQPESHPLVSWEQVKALYIRASEAEERLRQGLLKPLPKL